MTLFLMLGASLLAPASSAASAETRLTITGISGAMPDGTIPLAVSAGDLDGDGVADSGTLMLTCDKGQVVEALFANVKGPRDAGSGMASGKRTHVMPHVFDTAGPQLAALRPTYDLKTLKGGRYLSKKGYDYYQALSLAGADGLCPAASAQAATVKATKTRSNIQNN